MITKEQEKELLKAIAHEKDMNDLDARELQKWADQYGVEDYGYLIDNEDAMMDDDYHMMLRIARRMELSDTFIMKLERILNTEEK